MTSLLAPIVGLWWCQFFVWFYAIGKGVHRLRELTRYTPPARETRLVAHPCARHGVCLEHFTVTAPGCETAVLVCSDCHTASLVFRVDGCWRDVTGTEFGDETQVWLNACVVLLDPEPATNA